LPAAAGCWCRYVEDWLRDIAQLRAQVQGGPIPVQDLVAATERESH